MSKTISATVAAKLFARFAEEEGGDAGHWITIDGHHVFLEDKEVSESEVSAAADKHGVKGEAKEELLRGHAQGRIQTDRHLYHTIASAHKKATIGGNREDVSGPRTDHVKEALKENGARHSVYQTSGLLSSMTGKPYAIRKPDGSLVRQSDLDPRHLEKEYAKGSLNPSNAEARFQTQGQALKAAEKLDRKMVASSLENKAKSAHEMTFGQFEAMMKNARVATADGGYSKSGVLKDRWSSMVGSALQSGDAVRADVIDSFRREAPTHAMEVRSNVYHGYLRAGAPQKAAEWAKYSHYTPDASHASFSALRLFAKFSLEESARMDARYATNPAPSQAQVKRGNYAKGQFTWNGLKIAIENPVGSLREGINAQGVPWRTRMTCDYGYFTQYGGADGDKLDVLIGPDLAQEAVFVVDQKDADGDFDEAKVVIGCADIAEAHALYLSNYQEGWEVNIRNITPLTLTGFKAWLEVGEGAEDRSVFRGSAKPTRKAIEAARRQHVNESDSFCPDCGAVYEWADADERGEEQGACNQCGSHRPPVDGKYALESVFCADFSRADFNAGEFVTVPALLSRAGNYADKGIELTRQDFDRAAKTVSPTSAVPMNMAHLRRGSVLDDAGLGEIQRTWRRGDELWGEIAVPKWLASLARERGLKLPVSAEWDIKTKTLRGCAWERTPRIGDARAVI